MARSLPLDEEQRGPAVLDPGRDAVGPEQREERHGDRAALDRAEERAVEGQRRVEHDGDPIAALHPAPREEAREA